MIVIIVRARFQPSDWAVESGISRLLLERDHSRSTGAPPDGDRPQSLRRSRSPSLRRDPAGVDCRRPGLGQGIAAIESGNGLRLAGPRSAFGSGPESFDRDGHAGINRRQDWPVDVRQREAIDDDWRTSPTCSPISVPIPDLLVGTPPGVAISPWISGCARR